MYILWKSQIWEVIDIIKMKTKAVNLYPAYTIIEISNTQLKEYIFFHYFIFRNSVNTNYLFIRCIFQLKFEISTKEFEYI